LLTWALNIPIRINKSLRQLAAPREETWTAEGETGRLFTVYPLILPFKILDIYSNI
jgi:hypothetical protein